jgi:3-hydroxyisobutyrate dehydrogenase
MTQVAVLGLGAMGSGLASNLVEAGHTVTVWNRTASVADQFVGTHAAARSAATPAAAAAGADVVIAMVRDDAASEQVWFGADGAAAAMRPGAVAVEMSTVSPDWAVEWAARLPSAVDAVEAPVIGSRPQLAAKQLTSVVAGDPAVIERVQPVLDASAARVESVGAIGNAAQMKLFVNTLFAAQVAIYGEIINSIQASDLDTEASLAFISSLPITSPGLQRIVGLVGAANFAPNFPIELVAKDLGYASAAVGSLRGSAPITEAVQAAFDAAALDGRARLDIAGIAAPVPGVG